MRNMRLGCKVKKVKLFLCLINYALRHEGVWGSECIDTHFLDLGISWRWVVSLTPQLRYPGERTPGILWIGGWVDPRPGLDDVEKRKFLTLPGLEFLSFGRPASSQSLYRLRYAGSRLECAIHILYTYYIILLKFGRLDRWILILYTKRLLIHNFCHLTK
jgi:hypothetical protein